MIIGNVVGLRPFEFLPWLHKLSVITAEQVLELHNSYNQTNAPKVIYKKRKKSKKIWQELKASLRFASRTN